MKFVTYCVLATLSIAGIQASDSCGGTGILDIESPYPGANENCTWIILTNKSQVAIRFSDLNLDASVFNLTVLGVNVNVTLIANVTQYQGSAHVVSHFEETKIVLSRNDKPFKNDTLTAFKAHVADDCIEQISASVGVINSPVYLPNNGTITCSYQVTMATLGNVFVLSFSNFSLPHGNLTTQFGSQQNTTWTSLPYILIGFENESLNMILQLDAISGNQSFSADFRSADARCSGDFKVENNATDILLPTTSDYPVICYAHFSASPNTSHLLAVYTRGPSQLSGVDSIVFYDGLTSGAPIAGNIAEGLHIFVSSGENLKMVANLGINTLRSDTITVRQDAYSQLFRLTNETVSHFLNGTLVDSREVQLQFSSEIINQKIMIELPNDNNLTSATVTVASAMGTPNVTFNTDSVLFPVVIPTNRAIVTIRNLNETQCVTIKATAINDMDCNQLYTVDSGDVSFAAPANATMCTIAIVTAKHITLQFSSVNLCADSSLDIYDGLSKTAHKIATLKITSVNENIPEINFNESRGARLVWQSNSNCSKTTWTGHYFSQGISDDWCGNLGHKTILTPHFPNQYPLNVLSSCPIQSSKDVTYFSFNSVQMSIGHSVTIQSNDTTVITLNDSSLPLIDKIVTCVNCTVTFNSLTKGQDLEQTGQGVNMSYEFLDCGESVDKYDGTLMSPVNQSANCIWIISTLPSGNKTAYIVNASFSANNLQTNLKDLLEIRDGGSSRDPISDFTNNTFLSTTNLLWVNYKCPKSGHTDCGGLVVTYTTYNCSELCANGRCMKPGWKCDGKPHCSDGSDEFNCTAPPPPTSPTSTVAPSPSSPKGVASYWIFVCLMIGLIVGIILTVFAPRCINSIRGRGQHHHSNYGTLHEDA